MSTLTIMKKPLKKSARRAGFSAAELMAQQWREDQRINEVLETNQEAKEREARGERSPARGREHGRGRSSSSSSSSAERKRAKKEKKAAKKEKKRMKKERSGRHEDAANAPAGFISGGTLKAEQGDDEQPPAGSHEAQEEKSSASSEEGEAQDLMVKSVALGGASKPKDPEEVARAKEQKKRLKKEKKEKKKAKKANKMLKKMGQPRIDDADARLIPRDPSNPLLLASDQVAYKESKREKKERKRRKKERRDKGSDEEAWDHQKFLERSPSPCRVRTEGPMYNTRKDAWRSRAGGIYLPPEQRSQSRSPSPARYLYPEDFRQKRGSKSRSRSRSGSRPRSRGSPIYELSD